MGILVRSCCFLSLILVFVGSLHGREFTNLKGQKMEAEPVGLAAGKVVFKKTDGKQFTYALKDLVPEDQAFLKEWAKSSENSQNPLKVTEAKTVLIGKRRDTSVGDSRSAEEARAFEVEVRNSASEAIDGVIVCYTLFPQRDDSRAKGKKKSGEPVSGKIRLEAIPRTGSVTFRTKPVQLNSLNLSTENGRVRWKDTLSAANFHFFYADQLVASHYIGDFKDEGTPQPGDLTADADADSGS